MTSQNPSIESGVTNGRNDRGLANHESNRWKSTEWASPCRVNRNMGNQYPWCIRFGSPQAPLPEIQRENAICLSRCCWDTTAGRCGGKCLGKYHKQTNRYQNRASLPKRLLSSILRHLFCDATKFFRGGFGQLILGNEAQFINSTGAGTVTRKLAQ